MDKARILQVDLIDKQRGYKVGQIVQGEVNYANNFLIHGTSHFLFSSQFEIIEDFKVGDKVEIILKDTHNFDVGSVVEIVELIEDGYEAKDEDGLEQTLRERHIKAIKEEKEMTKFKKGDKVRILGTRHSEKIDRTGAHGFDKGEIVTIQYHTGGTEYFVASETDSYYVQELDMELVNDEPSTKHDGYVVIGIRESQPSKVLYGLTKEYALESIERLLEQGFIKENILVFAPNSNITFTNQIVLEED